MRVVELKKIPPLVLIKSSAIRKFMKPKNLTLGGRLWCKKNATGPPQQALQFFRPINERAKTFL
jgi:hypothetical protein